MFILSINRGCKTLWCLLIVAGALLLPLIYLLPTTTLTQTIMIPIYAYAESSDNNEQSSSISMSFDPKLVGAIKKNATQIMNHDNNSKSRDIESAFNNSLVSKDHFKNETSFFI